MVVCPATVVLVLALADSEIRYPDQFLAQQAHL